MDNNSKLEFDFANVTAELEKKNIKELRESMGMSRQEFVLFLMFHIVHYNHGNMVHGICQLSQNVY